MKLLHIDLSALSSYIKNQIEFVTPLSCRSDDLLLIDMYIPKALKRLDICISEVRMWKAGEFDVLHSSQYCTFLYYLSNTIWRHERNKFVCTRLFILNKALNSIDCFYEISLPEVFLIGHSVGIVLAKATYGNYLVLYQNSTVGKNHGEAPVIEDQVILYPSSSVIGRSVIKHGSIISQGVSVINKDTKKEHIVFQGNENGLVFAPPKHRIQADFFRNI